MKKALLLCAVVGVFATIVLAPSALGGNTPSGAGPAAPCGFGSCFVPQFTAVGQTNSYSGPLASEILFADCCTAGDNYKVSGKGPSFAGSVKWTSTGTLN